MPQDQLFEALEHASKDPLVEKFFAKVDEYQRLINDTPNPATTELKEIIADIDSQWPYMNEDMTLSGWVYVHQSDGPPVREWFEDKTVKSRGFWLEESPIEIDGEVATTTYEIVNYFQFSDEAGETRLAISRRQETTAEYPFESVEARRNRLEYHHAEILDMVDAVVLNEPDEEKALLAMRGVKATILRDEIWVLMDLSYYLDDILEFDAEAPYVIRLCGPGFIMSDAGTYDTSVRLPYDYSLARIKDLTFVEEDPNDDEMALFIPAIRLHYLPRTGKAVEMTVPLRNIDFVRSIRRQLYEPTDTGNS